MIIQNNNTNLQHNKYNETVKFNYSPIHIVIILIKTISKTLSITSYFKNLKEMECNNESIDRK